LNTKPAFELFDVQLVCLLEVIDPMPNGIYGADINCLRFNSDALFYTDDTSNYVTMPFSFI